MITSNIASETELDITNGMRGEIIDIILQVHADQPLLYETNSMKHAESVF
jgi:hypothetical protein